MKLTKTQLHQLLAYCQSVYDEGWYYGNKKYFDQRHVEIVKWIREQLGETI